MWRTPIPLLLLAALVSACGAQSNTRQGAACDRDGDCGELVCSAAALDSTAELAALELSCQPAAGGDPPGVPCNTSDACDRGICLLAGACARTCLESDDCRAEERCQQVFVRGLEGRLHEAHTCVARVSAPDDTRITTTLHEGVLSAGVDQVQLQGSDEPSLRVLVHAQDDNWPFSMRCRPPLCPSLLQLSDGGEVLWDAQRPHDAPAPLNPMATGDHLLVPTLLLPNGPRGITDPAGYDLTLSTEVPGDLRETSLSRDPGEGALRLDLNVFYVGARDWAPEGERGPAELADSLDEVERIFEQADIFIGDVRQIEVNEALAMRGNTYPEGDETQGFQYLLYRRGVLAELPALFELSAGAHNAAINLFFVADIESTDGELEGISGGTPGPLAMHGTGSSGVVFAANMMNAGPEDMGRTIAHELGHHLGLFHTSEADGSVNDPLPDTPECRNAQDSNGDGNISVEDCDGLGNDNLMFWAKVSGVVLTTDQRDVMRSAILLR